MKKLNCLFLAFSLLLPHAAHANRAEVMMLPPRVVMENNDRFSTIVIRNIGDATGDFTVGLQEMKMLETGMVVPLDPGETPQYSAMPYLHITPRSMTLKPGETQKVRLMVRVPENLEPGEYRTHAYVRLVNDNADAPANQAGKDAVIAVKANLVIIIPVIVRHSATTLSMGIADAKLSHDAKGMPSVDMYLTREGNRSSMGDISVTYIPQGGAPQLIKAFRGVAVYRPIPRRFISVPLDETPKGVSLTRGRLDIVYTAQEKEGGKTLAEAQLALP
jgi:P pilus assembly chaperone PapD